MHRAQMRSSRLLLTFMAVVLGTTVMLAGSRVGAFEYYVSDGVGVQVHGFVQEKLATISDGFRDDYFYLAEFSTTLNLEFEFDLIEEGWGPLDSMSAFARVEGRINCVYKSACGLSRSMKLYGDHAQRAPRNFTNGTTSGYSGDEPTAEGPVRIHDNQELLPLQEVPPFDAIFALGASPENLDRVLAPIDGAVFAVRKIDHDNPYGPRTLPQGPWRTGYAVHGVGLLNSVEDFTDPADPDPTDNDPRGGLLLRPKQDNLYIPSAALRKEAKKLDSLDLNLSENELFWNRGQSQDEGELKEAYFDIEMFDYHLWLRLGKQSIVWGKTELFRTTDQLNPTDLAVGALPSLEESRINLWSARAIWSFYNVGPLEDVRLEVAVLLDDFESNDFGRCGEPYTLFVVCGFGAGLIGHGLSGTGLVGVDNPPNFWESIQGLEGGVRLEWRWDRFSFALVDYYGYNDLPYLETFYSYERAVDPETGRPLDSNGVAYDFSNIGDPRITDRQLQSIATTGIDTLSATPLTSKQAQKQLNARADIRDQSRDFHAGNRQLFDLICQVTIGVAAAIVPTGGLDQACVIDVLNNQVDLGLSPFGPFSAANAFAAFLSGGPFATFIGEGLTGGEAIPTIPLNQDPMDGTGGTLPVIQPMAPGVFLPNCATIPSAPLTCLSLFLTDEQEALLGCGAYFGTDCDQQGVDIFNAEFSVLGQRFPNVEPEAPVGTRVVFKNGKRKVITLPGARAIDNAKYDPRVDGCVRRGFVGKKAAKDGVSSSFCNDGSPGRQGAFTDLSALGFSSELEAVSENFVRLLAGLGQAGGNDPECVPDGTGEFKDRPNPFNCDLVRAVVGISGVKRPDVTAKDGATYGRRDFIWHGGGEAVLKFNKRNVLGFSTDFAEDFTKSNWSIEATWINKEIVGNSTKPNGIDKVDIYNLTVSADRATFINFLNANRTFFFNSQWFYRYVADFKPNEHGGKRWDVLGTFTVGTGYFQDRLFPSYTAVHDFRSASGAGITSITYRYSEALSVSVGLQFFYGGPKRTRYPDYPLSISNQSPPYQQRTAYPGLSLLSETDQITMRLRYTF